MCLAAPSDSHSPPETTRLQRWGWLGPAGCSSPGVLGRCSAPLRDIASHLHASAMHLDDLGPEGLDPAQDGLLVFCQRDPQAEDVSAK